MGNLQTSVERLARRLQVVLIALSQQEEVGNINHQEIRRIVGQIFDQSNHEDLRNSLETFNEDQTYLRHSQLQEPILGLQDSEAFDEGEEDVRSIQRERKGIRR